MYLYLYIHTHKYIYMQVATKREKINTNGDPILDTFVVFVVYIDVYSFLSFLPPCFFFFDAFFAFDLTTGG